MAHDYQYYTHWAWIINLGLLASSIALSIVIIIYTAAKEYLWARRGRALLKIKNHVYELVLAGEKGREEDARRMAAAATSREFIDITTNRDRGLVFFNDSEQAIFKKYFLTPKKISELKRTAKSSFNKWRKIEAIAALGYTGTRDASAIIAKALFSKDEDMAYFSMISLGQLKDAAAAAALIKFLKKNPSNGSKIVSILENFSEETMMGAGEELKNKNPKVRLWTLVLLSKFKREAKRCIEEIEKLLEDRNAEVAAAACECLGRMGDKSKKEILIKSLKDGSWLVRASAVKALSELLGKDSIPILAGTIGDASLSVVGSVKDAMMANIEAAMPYLENFLYSNDTISKRVAVEAIEESGELLKIFGILASGDNAAKPRAVRFLKGMVESGAHLGLEGAVSKFDGNMQNKILAEIKKIDPVLESHIEKKLHDEICEMPT